jgi:hypothetical protein
VTFVEGSYGGVRNRVSEFSVDVVCSCLSELVDSLIWVSDSDDGKPLVLQKFQKLNFGIVAVLELVDDEFGEAAVQTF